MWIVIRTGETFENRKDAKMKLGHYLFNKMCHNKEIILLTEELKEFLKEVINK